MSGEKIINSEINAASSLLISQKSVKTSSRPVNINILLDRAREVEKKENRISLISVGLTLSLIFIVGIVLSF
jgi:hypothetical protein